MLHHVYIPELPVTIINEVVLGRARSGVLESRNRRLCVCVYYTHKNLVRVKLMQPLVCLRDLCLIFYFPRPVFL